MPNEKVRVKDTQKGELQKSIRRCINTSSEKTVIELEDYNTRIKIEGYENNSMEVSVVVHAPDEYIKQNKPPLLLRNLFPRLSGDINNCIRESELTFPRIEEGDFTCVERDECEKYLRYSAMFKIKEENVKYIYKTTRPP